MKTIIALSHIYNKGKTETLRFLANIFLNQFNSEILHISSNSKEIPKQGDFTIVLKVTIETKIHIIAIHTAGDPKSQLQKHLFRLADDYSCSIIFCATRTRGETVQAVDSLWEKRDYQTIWTTTYQIEGEENRGVINQLKARQLVEMIQELQLI